MQPASHREDARGPTPALEALVAAGFFSELGLGAGAPVAVPCCGLGHDLRVFARLGYEVTGFERTPALVREAAALLRLNRVRARVLCRDVLALEGEFGGRFDLVYDAASDGVLAPYLLGAFARMVAGVLAPGGYLLRMTRDAGAEAFRRHLELERELTPRGSLWRRL